MEVQTMKVHHYEIDIPRLLAVVTPPPLRYETANSEIELQHHNYGIIVRSVSPAARPGHTHHTMKLHFITMK